MAAVMQHRRKLLILENDRTLRRELEGIFSDLDVTAAEASEQVLALVRRTEPDVVLFDLGTSREPAVAAASLELLRQMTYAAQGDAFAYNASDIGKVYRSLSSYY